MTTDNPQIMNVFSPNYDPYDGYGRMALELAYHLDEQGVYVNAQGGANTQTVWGTQSKAIQELINKPIRPMVGGLLLGYPTLHKRYTALAQTGMRIAITMFESTKLPGDWMQALNECDAVIVPSKWLVKAMKHCGVIAPIHVVPLGISETFMVADKRDYHRVYTKLNPFTFLCWGDRGNRKGWDVAMQAFIDAFGDRHDVRLLVKAREGGSFPYEISNANIEIVRDDLDEFGLRDLYLRCDAMVFPARGEGFGLPPREFAATGGPVIATDWWADDIQEWGYPIRYKLVKAWAGHPNHDGLGKWAEPDKDHLVKQMKHLVNQDGRVISYMGQKSANHVAKLYRWDKFAEGVLDVWAKTEMRLSKKARRKKRNGAGNGS